MESNGAHCIFSEGNAARARAITTQGTKRQMSNDSGNIVLFTGEVQSEVWSIY